MAKLLSETAHAPERDDAFCYWTFKDLQARRIVASRTDLHRKQRFFGFPRPVILTGGRGANAIFKVGEVKSWLIERESLATRNTAPEMKAGSRPRGRPRKDSENKKPSRLADATTSETARKATLVIARLDRLGRNVHFISGLMQSGVPFLVCDRPNAKPFELHIYAALAEEETRAISARTKAALQAAKARGVRLGNPTNRDEAARMGSAANRERARQWADNIKPVIAQIQAAGITTLEGIARELNARNVKTSRGGEWHKMTVARVLKAKA